MPEILLVDLSGDSYEPYGPFNSPEEAEASAERSGFLSYALWESGKRIKLVKDATKKVVIEDHP